MTARGTTVERAGAFGLAFVGASAAADFFALPGAPAGFVAFFAAGAVFGLAFGFFGVDFVVLAVMWGVGRRRRVRTVMTVRHVRAPIRASDRTRSDSAATRMRAADSSTIRERGKGRHGARGAALRPAAPRPTLARMTASGTPNAAAAAPPERVLSPALALAFALAAAAVFVGWRSAHPTLDFAGALAQLGDGDLDGAEARQRCARLVELAATAAGPAQTWAVALAALALDDRAAWTAAAPAVLADVAAGRTPPTGERRLLSLGDPLYAAIRDAWLAEAGKDRAAAAAAWRRARDFADLAGRTLARDVAAAELARLGG